MVSGGGDRGGGGGMRVDIAYEEGETVTRSDGKTEAGVYRWFVNMYKAPFDSEVRVTIPLQHVPWQHPPYLPPPFPLLACVNLRACGSVTYR